MKQHRLSTDLFRFLDSVSEERRLVLAVVKQDVERHLAAHHVVDRLLHHIVEVSGWVHLVKHVVHLRHVSTLSSVCFCDSRSRFDHISRCYLVLFPQQLQGIQFDL